MQKTIKLSLTLVAFLSSLNAKDITLKPITITSATKTEQSIKDVTSNVSVITSQEIEEKHFTTLAEALNSIAGINFTSNGGIGSTTSINLRGAGNNRTLVLIDGVRYQDPSSVTGANIAHIMIGDIEQIEVIKGAQSGIWGADASAGVINIITKKAKNGTHTSINVEGGSFKTKKYGASVSHKTSKFDVKLSANKITSDSFSSQAPFGENLDKYEDDAYENLTLNLQLNYNITDTAKISASVMAIEALKEYDVASPDDKTMKSDISNKLYSLAYLQTYKNHNFVAKVQRSDFARDEIGTVSAWGMQFVKEFEGTHRNIELSDTISYNKKDFAILGVGTSSDEVDYIMTDKSTKNKKNKNNYIYLTNSNTFDNLIFTQSVRHDKYNNFDNKTTGKLGAKYNFTKDIFATANAGLAYNVPNIVQELNPWGGANENLNPENTKSYDISLGYKNFKATYFHNKVTDLIEWYDPDGWGGVPAIYKNLNGETILKGYEFEYAQDITEEILLSVNYSILSAKDKDGKKLARRPKDTMKVNLDYYPLDSLHLGLSGEYIGERFDEADKKGRQTGRYTVANFVVNYDINKNFSTYAKVDNIFNKYYQVIDGYATAPRSIYVGLNAKF